MVMWNFPLHPPADSSLATHVDHLFYAWLALAGVVTVAVFFLIVYFSVKYRHGSRADRVLPARGKLRRESHRIEIAWIVTPLILFLGMGFWAAGLIPDDDWNTFVDAYRDADGPALPHGDPWQVLEPFARAAVVQAAAHHPDDAQLRTACGRML